MNYAIAPSLVIMQIPWFSIVTADPYWLVLGMVLKPHASSNTHGIPYHLFSPANEESYQEKVVHVVEQTWPIVFVWAPGSTP